MRTHARGAAFHLHISYRQFYMHDAPADSTAHELGQGARSDRLAAQLPSQESGLRLELGKYPIDLIA